MVPTGTLSTAEGILRNPDAQTLDFDPARVRNAGRLLDLFGYLAALPSAHAVGYVFPSNAHLARRCGVSVRTIERWISRLAEIGAVALDFVDGIERRVRILMSARRLRETLLRGVGAKARLARSSVGGSVGPVVRGLPIESRQTEDDDGPPVVVQTPEPDPAVRRLAEAAARAYADRHPVRSWPALLRVAIRDRWEPPAAVATEARVGPHRLVTAPKDYALRSKEARQAVSAPQPGAEGAGSGPDGPKAHMGSAGGREAFLAAVKALRGRA